MKDKVTLLVYCFVSILYNCVRPKKSATQNESFLGRELKCVFVCVCVRMYVCMYVYMYVCIFYFIYFGSMLHYLCNTTCYYLH